MVDFSETRYEGGTASELGSPYTYEWRSAVSRLSNEDRARPKRRASVIDTPAETGIVADEAVGTTPLGSAEGKSDADEIPKEEVQIYEAADAHQFEGSDSYRLQRANADRISLLARKYVLKDQTLSDVDLARLIIVTERVRRLLPAIALEDVERVESVLRETNELDRMLDEL